MQPDFWHQRWSTNKLGFHQQKVNTRLRRHWHTLGLPSDAPVLAPLCGKSIDLVWLATAGHPVLGIEISPLACRSFFQEQALPFTTNPFTIHGTPFTAYRTPAIELWCGDFFALTPTTLPAITGVYDRAALIALPPLMRRRYAAHLTALLPAARTLLIGMEYDPTKMKGPPFSVPESEIRTLFEPHYKVTVIAHSSGPDIVGNLAARGLDTLTEKIYTLTPP